MFIIALLTTAEKYKRSKHSLMDERIKTIAHTWNGILRASSVAQRQGIRLPVQEMRVRSLGRDDPPERKCSPLQYSCLGNPMDRGD